MVTVGLVAHRSESTSSKYAICHGCVLSSIVSARVRLDQNQAFTLIYNATASRLVPARRADATSASYRAGLEAPRSKVVDHDRRSRRPDSCVWCGREVAETGMGRRRRYCRQSCRQRAYEQRNQVKGTSIPADAVVLTSEEASAMVDRVFQVRCAAEDVATAVAEGAAAHEVESLCADLVQLAREAERFR